MKLKIAFTTLDLCNLTKWNFFKTNPTLQNVIESLKRENTAKNHILILQQAIGYLRALTDLGMLEKNAYMDIVAEIHFLQSEINRENQGGR